MRKLITLFLAVSFIFVLSCDDTEETEDQTVPLVASYSITHVSEYGASDGSISVTVTEGTEPYKFKLDDGNFQSVSSFTGLSANTFIVTVMDGAEDVVIFDNLIITEPLPDEIIIDTVINHVSTYLGNDGSITINVSGGVPPYLYKLDDDDFISDNIFSDLIKGNYSITVKDDLDSIKTIDVEITEPDYVPMTLNITTSEPSTPYGSDALITIVVTGGIEPYMYKLDDGEFINNNYFLNYGAGDYLITVKDGVDSIKTEIATINGYVPMTFNLTKTDVTINGTNDGSITITDVNGGDGNITYSIDNTNWITTTTFDELVAGDYTIYLKDDFYTVSKDITITEPDVLTGSVATETAQGEITISGTIGGVTPYTYNVDGGTFVSTNVFIGLSDGGHIFIVKDANGATDEVTTTLNGLSIGDEYLGGIVFELNGTYPNQTGKVVADFHFGGDRNTVIYNISNYNTQTTWRLPYLEELQYLIPKDKDGTFPLICLSRDTSRQWINNDNPCEYGQNGNAYDTISYLWEDVRCTYYTDYGHGLAISTF